MSSMPDLIDGPKQGQKKEGPGDESARNGQGEFSYPVSHSEVEGNYSQIKRRPPEAPDGDPVPPRASGPFPPFAHKRLKNLGHNDGHKEPSHEVAHGNAEVGSLFPIPIDLSQEPLLPSQGHRIHNHIQEDHEETRQYPDTLFSMSPLFPVGSSHRGHEKKGCGITTGSDEHIGDRVHERHAHDPQLLVPGGLYVIVIPVREAPIYGTELGQEGDQVSQRQEDKGGLTAELPGGPQEIDGQENENIWPEGQGSQENFHLFQVKFHRIIRQRSRGFFPSSLTTVGSKPQCIMQLAQRGSSPLTNLSHGVLSISSLKV